MTLKEEIKHLEEIANKTPYENYIGTNCREIDIAKQALVIIKKQEGIIDKAIKVLKAIADDNAGEFGNYSFEELLEHIKNEKWFCENYIKNFNKLLEEND